MCNPRRVKVRASRRLSQAWQAGAAAVARFAAGIGVSRLTVGGGLGVVYEAGQSAPTFAEWAMRVGDAARGEYSPAQSSHPPSVSTLGVAEPADVTAGRAGVTEGTTSLDSRM